MKKVWLYFFIIVASIFVSYLLYNHFVLQLLTEKSAIQKSNIVLILGDDIGFSDIGPFGSEIKTPNLDRLADEGIRFSNFYNMSKCEPSRSTLFSGLYEGGKNAVNLAQVLKKRRILCHSFRERTLDEMGSATCNGSQRIRQIIDFLGHERIFRPPVR